MADDQVQLADLPQDIIDGLGAMSQQADYSGADATGMQLASTGGALARIGRSAGKAGLMLSAAVKLLGPAAGFALAPVIASSQGLSLQAVVNAFLGKTTRRRSRRGITGRQLAIARSTIGKVERMHRSLSHAFGRAARGGFHTMRAPSRRKGK